MKCITTPSGRPGDDENSKDKTDRNTNANSGDNDGDDKSNDDDDDPNDFYAYEVFTEFERGESSERKLQRVTRGFLALLS